MIKKSTLIILLAICSLKLMANQTIQLQSPDRSITLIINHQIDGSVLYELKYKGIGVIGHSQMGFQLKEPEMFLRNFDLISIDSSTFNGHWQPIWGETKTIQTNYKELVLKLSSRTGNKILLIIFFRLFNDGMGFRYEFPKQSELNHFIIKDELSEFKMNGNHQAFWIPGDYDTNEYSYYHTAISDIDATGGGAAQEIHAKTFFDKNAVQTPLMMKTKRIHCLLHRHSVFNNIQKYLKHRGNNC